jgi:hypothetical protein
VSCRVVSCRVVSCRVVSCRVVSCRVVSCRVVPYFACCSCRLRHHRQRDALLRRADVQVLRALCRGAQERVALARARCGRCAACSEWHRRVAALSSPVNAAARRVLVSCASDRAGLSLLWLLLLVVVVLLLLSFCCGVVNAAGLASMSLVATAVKLRDEEGVPIVGLDIAGSVCVPHDRYHWNRFTKDCDCCNGHTCVPMQARRRTSPARCTRRRTPLLTSTSSIKLCTPRKHTAHSRCSRPSRTCTPVCVSVCCR